MRLPSDSNPGGGHAIRRWHFGQRTNGPLSSVQTFGSPNLWRPSVSRITALQFGVGQTMEAIMISSEVLCLQEIIANMLRGENDR